MTPPDIQTIAAERDALAAQLRKITLSARKGGKARWKGTTKAQRSEAMRNAVNARWARASNNPIKNENG